jgi:hypothetical protein
LKHVGALWSGLAYLSWYNSGWFCHILGLHARCALQPPSAHSGPCHPSRSTTSILLPPVARAWPSLRLLPRAPPLRAPASACLAAGSHARAVPSRAAASPRGRLPRLARCSQGRIHACACGDPLALPPGCAYRSGRASTRAPALCAGLLPPGPRRVALAPELACAPGLHQPRAKPRLRSRPGRPLAWSRLLPRLPARRRARPGLLAQRRCRHGEKRGEERQEGINMEPRRIVLPVRDRKARRG